MKHHDGFNRLPWKIKTFLCEDKHSDSRLKSMITACHIYLSFIGFFVRNTTEWPHALFPMVYVIRLNSSLKSIPLKLESYELQAERYVYIIRIRSECDLLLSNIFTTLLSPSNYQNWCMLILLDKRTHRWVWQNHLRWENLKECSQNTLV